MDDDGGNDDDDIHRDDLDAWADDLERDQGNVNDIEFETRDDLHKFLYGDQNSKKSHVKHGMGFSINIYLRDIYLHLISLIF